MTDKAKEARRAYKRKWQRENRDKVKEYQTRYWNKKAEQAEAATEPAPAIMEG
jgi:hypothetical protein